DLDTTADVLVVGTGIAGLSAAYELALRGRSVVAVDRGPVGGGMTARTTAHLAFAFDDYYHEMIDLHGRDRARQVRESHEAAVDRIEAIQRDEGIACDFARLPGYLFAAREEDVDLLSREH